MHPDQDTDRETAALLRDAAAHFLSQNQHRAHEGLRNISPQQSALQRTRWQQWAQQGWLGLRWPQALGGSGLGLHSACSLAEQLGQHLLPEPYAASAFMPAVLAEHLAPAGHSAAWQTLAEQCISGDALPALAWQDHAQALDDITTACAQSGPTGIHLTARKCAVVAADMADIFLVTAVLDGEPALWQIPADRGIQLHTHVGSDGSSLSVVQLHDIELAPHALLARGAQLQVAYAHAVDETLLLVSAQLLGITDAAQVLTLEHLRTRQQFDHPIGSFQSMQHAAVDVRLQATLARASHRDALQRHLQAPGLPTTRAAIAAAKARASDAALQAGRFGVQAHGAMGFATESDIGLYLKAALRLSAYLGNGTQQRHRYSTLLGLHQG